MNYIDQCGADFFLQFKLLPKRVFAEVPTLLHLSPPPSIFFVFCEKLIPVKMEILINLIRPETGVPCLFVFASTVQSIGAVCQTTYTAYFRNSRPIKKFAGFFLKSGQFKWR